MRYSDIYYLFFSPGEVTEVRAIGANGKNKAWEGFAGGGGVVYGYFDNAEAFGLAAESLERAKAPGIYFVLNPVNPELLARASDRLKAAGVKSPTTSDKDVMCLRWLYLDLDPVRPSGISTTDLELARVLKLRREIARWLVKKQGWPVDKMVPAMSGNGAHLLIRLPELANDPENVQRIKSALAAIAREFQGPYVDIDLSVYNPARICKLYGTTARKGDSTKTRPHRKSFIEKTFMEVKE